MTREVFVVKMRREEERWGRGKDFCSGVIELYFEPSGKLVKKIYLSGFIPATV